MTLQEAKSIARHLGCTLRKVRSGDYCVKFPDGSGSMAYYTDSLEDAVNVAVAVVRKRERRNAHTELGRNLSSPRPLEQPVKQETMGARCLVNAASVSTHLAR